VSAYEKRRVLVIFSKPTVLDDAPTDAISSSLGIGTGYAVTLELLLRGDGVLSMIAEPETQNNWAGISQKGIRIYALKEDMDDRGIEVKVPTFRVITYNHLFELLDSSDAIIHY